MSLAELNEELEQDWGVKLQVHIGVNTGEVVVRGQVLMSFLVRAHM
jgi:class 3 adenylate cyclase